ncbi:MAG: protein kinase [Firmicutes bacterium HGW-Firmicutes-14]|nr:MAG: protein kinase [Firmicutes bacterium HGW-Firmicutes-14]
MIGQILGGRYEIVSQLGGGGMAIVFKARDTLLNRRVTVKVLRSEYTSDEEFVTRFRREAQAVAKLSHSNIVSVYDVGQQNDTHYIVMEYIEGRNLKQIINEQGKLPVKKAMDIARQICDGVQDAHDNGIVHRDIKPHNILVTDNGRVKVTDFGIAQIMSSVTMTNSETIVGSVHYFSPEQARGGTTGAKSDIYSVGVVLYEMVTGRVPFEGETPIAVALKHINSEPVPPGKFNPNISPELERIILRAMQKDVTRRYMNAGDMARDLKKLLNGDAIDDRIGVGQDEFATRVMNGPFVKTRDQADEEERERPYRKKKKRLKPAVLILIVVILGLLAGAGYYGITNLLAVPDVIVPNVTGITAEDAQAKLKDSGLQSGVNWVTHPEVERNYVIKQDPAASEKVKENTKVQLTVSLGPEYVTVPNVVRKEQAQAEIDLDNAGFEPKVTTEEYDDEVPAGAVIRQSPEGDTEAKEGSIVKLVVSLGPEPRPVKVPDLVGVPLKDAQAKLDEAKLQLSPDISQEKSAQFLPGYVISQDPAAGTEIQEGEQVKVVLSLGPGPEAKTARVKVKVPDDGLVHKVKIVVIDVVGTRVAVEPEEVGSGDEFSKLVNYYDKGKIQVFVDDFETPFDEKLVH